MHVAAVRAELLIRDARSLKDKRRVLKRLTESLHTRFRVAVSEVDHQELWQRATVGVAAVAPQAGQVERVLHRALRALEQDDEVEVLSSERFYLEQG